MLNYQPTFKTKLFILLFLTIKYVNSQSKIENNIIKTSNTLEVNSSVETQIIGQSFISDCNIGNELTMPNTITTYSQNILFAQPFNLSNQGVLTGLGYTGIASISQIKMALYDDLNGSPNSLLVETTEIAQMNSGLQIIGVSQITLNPGDYWIAFVMDTSDFIDHWETECVGISNQQRHFLFLSDFEDNLPSSFSGSNVYFNNCKDPIFAQISCGELGVDEYSLNFIEAYPNPVKDRLYFTGLNKDEPYTIYSSLGKKIKSNILISNSYVDTSNLNSGLYFIKFANGFSYKFLKN